MLTAEIYFFCFLHHSPAVNGGTPNLNQGQMLL